MYLHLIQFEYVFCIKEIYPKYDDMELSLIKIIRLFLNYYLFLFKNFLEIITKNLFL